MKHVSWQSIEQAIQLVDNLDDESLEKLSEKYALAQQTLLNYVMSAAVEYDNKDLDGLLIYYFCLISESFNQERLTLKPISEDDIEAFEEPYFELLDQYFESEGDSDLLDDFCDQPELTRFMSMEISTDDEDGSAISDETATQLFIVTIAMIGLMGRAIQN